MKYAIKYYQECRALPNADEIIIKYYERSIKLLDFIQTLSENQRLIIDITQLKNKEENLEIFKPISEKYSNFTIMTSLLEEDYKIWFDNKINFFFKEGAETFEQVQGMIRAGVSDIYIINELGFKIADIAPICHRNNIKIRVFPNIAQAGTNFPIENLKKFFIRPEDVELYEPYIDIFEFYGPLNRQPILREIYEDRHWPDDLSILILGFDSSLDSRTIAPQFGEYRLNCGKKCILDKCNLCTKIATFAYTLTKGGLEITQKEEEEKEDGNSRVNKEDLQNASASSERLVETLP